MNIFKRKKEEKLKAEETKTPEVIEKPKIKYKYKVGRKVFYIQDYKIHEDRIKELSVAGFYGEKVGYVLEDQAVSWCWGRLSESEVFSTKKAAEKKLKRILEEEIAERIKGMREALDIVDKSVEAVDRAVSSLRKIKIDAEAIKEELAILTKGSKKLDKKQPK